MPTCEGVPAPARTTGFSPDEVLIYGLRLYQRGLTSVFIRSGGSGYDRMNPPVVDFSPAISDPWVKPTAVATIDAAARFPTSL
jgi:hypothetical protein